MALPAVSLLQSQEMCEVFYLCDQKNCPSYWGVQKYGFDYILNGRSAGSANVIKWHWFHATIVNRLNRHGHIMISRLKCKYPALREAVYTLEFAIKTEIKKFFIFSQKKPFVKHFWKSQSKFSKNFLFWENRQKVKCCPTPCRRSKTFELYYFQSPWEERKFKETNSSLEGK